ncbi:hypothetical protein PUNSTDRAFT_138321 [Punctularia strigosozonata HHB-11173 SS5]|uniref:Uncharacterized protein n=1 Tax=Punctularia strigosozonata (strain HHB-11173) TaxID=741275 RepID=R7S371_PUNST|nr:uncharacterized protein PUNSTDRAFT_138321 [Punctularia strigosozonata HHB-11173 SS5]EIN04673.1 hypothetical protein PUNSTDRAFT_138321 [Punctularia strigosozonata HHB-11173 SS5]
MPRRYLSGRPEDLRLSRFRVSLSVDENWAPLARQDSISSLQDEFQRGATPVFPTNDERSRESTPYDEYVCPTPPYIEDEDRSRASTPSTVVDDTETHGRTPLTNVGWAKPGPSSCFPPNAHPITGYIPREESFQYGSSRAYTPVYRAGSEVSTVPDDEISWRSPTPHDDHADPATPRPASEDRRSVTPTFSYRSPSVVVDHEIPIPEQMQRTSSVSPPLAAHSGHLWDDWRCRAT